MSSITKLNLGSGLDYKEGYINVDNQKMFPECRVDIQADITTLEFTPNKFDEILVSHVVMYFRPKELLTLVEKWYTWLKPGGKLIIETIDLIEVMLLASADDDPETQRDWGLVNIFGTEVTGPHKWGWTYQRLAGIVYQAGFKHFNRTKGEKKPDRDFRIIATK